MTRYLFRKRLQSLVPDDDASAEALRRFGQGEVVSVELHKPRNINHHRLFWALMSLVWDNLDHDTYPSVEALVTEAKIITGHYDRRDIVVDGTRYPVLTPKSISFAQMDQLAFDTFFNKCCDWIARDILPGIDREVLRHEVMGMTGICDY